jgi:hypothetical protein
MRVVDEGRQYGEEAFAGIKGAGGEAKEGGAAKKGA